MMNKQKENNSQKNSQLFEIMKRSQLLLVDDEKEFFENTIRIGRLIKNKILSFSSEKESEEQMERIVNNSVSLQELKKISEFLSSQQTKPLINGQFTIVNYSKKNLSDSILKDE